MSGKAAALTAGGVCVGFFAFITLLGGTASDDRPVGYRCIPKDAPTFTVTSTEGAKAVIGPEQLGYATQMLQRARRSHVTGKGVKVMLMTTLQESQLRMLGNPRVPESLRYPHDGLGSNLDSINMFQQRAGNRVWGPSVAAMMRPGYSIDAFLGTIPGYPTPGLLEKVPHYDDPGIDPAWAAQQVQVSAFGQAYAQWETSAEEILDKASGASCTAGGDLPSGARGRILKVALAQVGGPYVFGGGDYAGPSSPATRGRGTPCRPRAGSCGFDCSGLVEYAYWHGAHVQVTAQRGSWTGTQWPRLQQLGNVTRDIDDLKPGDAMFFARPGQSLPFHVALYLGHGQMVQAANPRLGILVSDISASWRSTFIGGGTFATHT